MVGYHVGVEEVAGVESSDEQAVNGLVDVATNSYVLDCHCRRRRLVQQRLVAERMVEVLGRLKLLRRPDNL
jgi:hypothetical protein